MGVWESFPSPYCLHEVQAILRAVRAGECVSIVGLSGSGKSNLVGFLAERASTRLESITLIKVDCNRLSAPNLPAFYRLLLQSMHQKTAEREPDLDQATDAVTNWLESHQGSLCLLLDRFDALLEHPVDGLFNNLRSLRDMHKYRLTYVITTRRPLPAGNELAELFFAHTVWLGPLSQADARWSVEHYARRVGMTWSEDQVEKIIEISGGYASFVRAVCEAAADGAALTLDGMSRHPAVQARLDEFWLDAPDAEAICRSGLQDNPLLKASQVKHSAMDRLTFKEKLLWDALKARPGEIQEKDELIRAVWPEDRIFNRGLRDDSLAQLVRRLREKLETDASHPQIILTVPGRGYRYLGQAK